MSGPFTPVIAVRNGDPGPLVRGANFLMGGAVVSRRLRLLSARTRQVATTITHSTATRARSKSDAQHCRIPVDSDDEIGDSTAAFNNLKPSITCTPSRPNWKPPEHFLPLRCWPGLGGDEFVALLPTTDGHTSAVHSAERFLCAVEEPVYEDGLAIHVRASIGIAA